MVKLQIFVGFYREKLETVQIGDYTDQSNEILKEMRVNVDEEDKEN